MYSLPIYFIKFEEYPFIENYIQLYLYWGSVIGMVFILLFILGIVLSPAEVTSVKLNDDKGILEIKKKCYCRNCSVAIRSVQFIKGFKSKCKNV